jgi:hypothetical protein
VEGAVIEAVPLTEEQAAAIERRVAWLNAVLPMRVVAAGALTLREAALHEAAHAVVAIALDFAVFTVLAGGDERFGHDGLTVYARTWNANEEMAAVAVAGVRVLRWAEIGVSDAEAFFEASNRGDLTPGLLLDRATMCADALIEQHREAIETIADEIEERGIVLFDDETRERLRPQVGDLPLRAHRDDETLWWRSIGRPRFFPVAHRFSMLQPEAQRILAEHAEEMRKAAEAEARVSALPWEDVGGFQARPFQEGAGAIVRACPGAPEYSMPLATVERVARIAAGCLERPESERAKAEEASAP